MRFGAFRTITSVRKILLSQARYQSTYDHWFMMINPVLRALEAMLT